MLLPEQQPSMSEGGGATQQPRPRWKGRRRRKDFLWVQGGAVCVMAALLVTYSSWTSESGADPAGGFAADYFAASTDSAHAPRLQARRLSDTNSTEVETCGPSNEIQESDFPVISFLDPPKEKKAAATIFYLVVMLFMFLGLAIVCDEYFEAALEEICRAMNLKDDVAGATWMAAGGSAPELATSLMGTLLAFSDVGFGTIVGSAVFNVLFVIACCAFVAPNLSLHWYPLARDSIYYCLSIVVLVFVIIDTKILWWEAVILLMMYVAYVTMMYFNEKLEAWVQQQIKKAKGPKAPWRQQLIWAFEQHATNIIIYLIIIANTVIVILDLTRSGAVCTDELEASGEYCMPETEYTLYNTCNIVFSIIFALEMVLKFAAYGFFGYWRDPLNCFDGVLVFLIAMEWAIIATQSIITAESAGGPSDSSFMGAVRSLRIFRFLRTVRTLRLIRLYRAFHKHYKDATTQVVPDDWLNHQREASNGSLTETSSTAKKNTAVVAPAPSRPSIVGVDPPPEDDEDDEDDEPANPFEIPDSWTSKIIWLIGLPLSISMFLTIPDCRRPIFRRFWGLTFLMAIAWIGGLTFIMVWMVTEFGILWGVPDAVMGLTLLAAGTSIPDALSSIAVAKRGHGDMAVSSSIGSNIFDILIGLPIPWLIYGLIFFPVTERGFKVGGVAVPYVIINSDGLTIMILMLFIMVALVVTTVHLCGWRLLIRLGYMMMFLYFVFLLLSLLIEFGVILCPAS